MNLEDIRRPGRARAPAPSKPRASLASDRSLTTIEMGLHAPFGSPREEANLVGSYHCSQIACYLIASPRTAQGAVFRPSSGRPH